MLVAKLYHVLDLVLAHDADSVALILLRVELVVGEYQLHLAFKVPLTCDVAFCLC